MRRSIRILGWSVAGLLLAIVVAGGLVVVRLSSGPLPLEFLTPYVARALSDPSDRFKVEVGSLSLAWVEEDGADGLTRIDLRASQVRAVNKDGQELGAVPELGIGFSVGRLFRGSLSPTRLELVRPRLEVLRQPDGSIEFDVRTPGEMAADDPTAGQDEAGFSSEIIQTLLQPPDPRHPFGLLRSIAVIGADITVVNRMLGLYWHANEADVIVSRDDDGIRTRARLELDLGDHGGEAEMWSTYRFADQQTRVGIGFSGVEPVVLSRLASLAVPQDPALVARLGDIVVPLGGQVEATLDERFDPLTVAFNLTGERGLVTVGELAARPFEIDALKLRGRIEVGEQRVVLDQLHAAVDGNLVLNAHGALMAEPGGVATDLDLTLSSGGQDSTVKLASRPREVAGETGHHVTLRIDEPRPARFSTLAPGLDILAGLRLPVTAEAEITLDEAHFPRSGSGTVRLGQGYLIEPSRFANPVDIRSGELRLSGSWPRNPAASSPVAMTLEHLALDLEGPTLSAAGSMTSRFEGAGPELLHSVSVEANDVPVDLVRNLWPMGVGRNARNWVTTNLMDGIVRHATARVDAVSPLARPLDLSPPKLDARIEGSGVTAHYFRPLPPVKDISFVATSDGPTFTVHTKGGRLDDAEMGDGVIHMSKLDGNEEEIDIRLPVKGPVRTILSVLDHPPLGYPSRLSLDPKGTRGNAQASLHFAFPLLVNLDLEDVQLKVTGKMQGVGVEKVVAGMNATEGDLSLDLDTSSMTIKGTTKLDGIAARIDWKEQFNANAKGPRTRISAKGEPTAAELKGIGIDLEPFVSGPIGTDLVFSIDQRKRFALSADLDVTKTDIKIDELGWHKRAGVPGKGALALGFEGDEITRISKLTLDAAGLQTTAAITLAPKTLAPTRALIERLTVGATDIRADIAIRSTPGQPVAYTGTVSGASLDARPFMSGDKDDGSGKAPAEETAGATEGADRAVEPKEKPQNPLDFALKLDRMVFGEGRHLSGVAGAMRRNEQAWTNLDVTAGTGGGNQAALRYVPDAAGHYVATVKADDAGALMRALDLTDRVSGGRLAITGRTRTAHADAPIVGSIELTNYTVVDAPVLARILNSISPTGFAELMGGGKGINFGRLSSQFVKDGPAVSLSELRTAGSALGLTLEGELDTKSETANLRGTIVPVYGLNRLLGQIPILGDALSGGEGQGLFSATWHASGKLSDPSVSVNPLAMLAPGFLRNLFFLGNGDSPEPWLNPESMN